MKYGVGTPMANCGLIESLGFDYIELPGNQIAKLTDAEFDQLQQELEASKLTCCGFNAALPPEIVLCGEGFDLEAARTYVEGLCKRGARLKISAIGVGSPKSRRFKTGDDVEAAWAQVEAFMGMFADVAAEYGLIVMYESLNHTESQFGLRIREGADLVKKLGKDNVKLVFDIYHMHMEQEDIGELLYALPYVHHVHIAERVGEERRYPSEDLRDYYLSVLKPVVESGYKGAICTEAFDGDIKEGAIRSMTLLKGIFAELEGVS